MKKKIPAMLLVTTLLFAGCARVNTQPEMTTAPTTVIQTEPTAATQTEPAAEITETVAITEPQPAGLTVETPWLPLIIPGEYAAYMTHKAVSEGDVTMILFYMTTEDTELELFRVYFGDSKTGTYLGSLHVDGNKIPVTLSVCVYSEDVFPDEQTCELYYSLMDGMNKILDCLYSDSRFSSEENVVVEREEKQVSYWNFSLSTGMDLEEVWEDNGYRVDFYGTVDGNRFLLYSIALGDAPLKTILGTYPMNGQAKPVSVESYDLPDVTGWPQDSAMELYSMMDTINDVIQVITSSENFSAEMPEG